MRNYRDNWLNVGAVLAIAIAGALALSHQRKLSRSRLFSALNFAALLVHQFEKYGFPAYFPGHLNSGLFKCDKPDRYPLNADRKSTRLNSSHANISYAVFCLKKKKIHITAHYSSNNA